MTIERPVIAEITLYLVQFAFAEYAAECIRTLPSWPCLILCGEDGNFEKQSSHPSRHCARVGSAIVQHLTVIADREEVVISRAE